jgi:hypothetical protein
MTAMDLLFAVFIAPMNGAMIYLDWIFKRLWHGEDLPDR